MEWESVVGGEGKGPFNRPWMVNCVFLMDCGCFMGGFWSVVNEDDGKEVLDRPWHLGCFT